ncbi:hypothetical protein LTR37_010352 [Vermiconidia calcicola]|uniref:Uncharacterized protein n=1 Tax=Vermiconidia calcicola TaxID=1690605 RepID=A0ACC3N528_9PEZI|nr:hypothetical protein LTR37_010352 [Vermiconidia calcicola]
MSLFNRPAWAKSQTSEVDESEENIFSHSNRSYRDIVAEQERKKKVKLERKKAKEERRSSGKRVKDEPSDGSNKRRRISAKDGEELLSLAGMSSADAGAKEDLTVEFEEADEPVRRSPRINRHVNRSPSQTTNQQSRSTQVVELGDSDEEEKKPVYATAPTEAVEIHDESDEEFAEFARRARLDRQRRQVLDKKSHTTDIGVHSPSPAPSAIDTGQRSMPTPPPDPVVSLLISSPIPDTNPLIVQRKLSQRIQEIRIAWCEKQHFSGEFTKDVFLIHRMRKIYDVTTCKSLGLEVDSWGNIVMKGSEGREGVEKVHLEAVTDDIFREMKAERARESKRRSGELPPEEDAGVGAANGGETIQPPEEILIRVVLKAKGKKDFKLKVRPTTPFSKLIAAYRKTFQLDSGQSVSLEFDGERLNPDDEVQSTEISDMDCLDVHVN